MKIFPAIDIRGGKVVRLTRGDYGAMTVYSSDPGKIAAGFKEDGAEFLHMVDLDGARDGSMTNFEAISVTALKSGLFTQVGGGIRDMERVDRYLASGVSRVILGTAAAENQDFLKSAVAKYGRRVAVGVDVKDGVVAVRGWLEATGLDGYEFCVSLRDNGVQTVIYTDISRDGMMQGPNHEIYSRLSEISGLSVIASGGVSGLDDIIRLKKTGVCGVVIGKALYTGAVDLKSALEAAI